MYNKQEIQRNLTRQLCFLFESDEQMSPLLFFTHKYQMKIYDRLNSTLVNKSFSTTINVRKLENSNRSQIWKEKNLI